MRIAIYFSPLWSVAKPTGVGRHMAEMSIHVARANRQSTMLLASKSAYLAAKGALPDGLAELPVALLPGSESVMRGLLLYTRWIAVDRWCPGVDWVYCPKEQPVTTKNARLAVTVHDVLPFERDVPGLERPWRLRNWARWRLTMSKIVARADRIATVSEFTKQRFLRLFRVRDEERVVVVGNGVSPVFFRHAKPEDAEVLQRYGLRPGGYVVMSGGLQARKGAEAALQLAEKLKRCGGRLMILVTGRRHEAKYRPVVEGLHHDPEQLPMRLPGYIPDGDLAVILTHSIALVYPSLYEGFGIPAAEAMAAGTPVIYNPAGALPEVVGDAGIPVDSSSADPLHAAVCELVDSDTKRNHYVEKGRSRAEMFTWERCASRLLAALSSA